MWSSVRRYRGRSTRDDDLIISCSCITDWCFTWCGKQCNKKTQQRVSISSQLSTESDQSDESKCCTFGGCCVQTTQIRGSVDQGSQVLQEETDIEGDQPEWSVQEQIHKGDTNEEEVNDVGHWSYLRRFRPRFFNSGGGADVSGDHQGRQDGSKPSRFRRLSLWFRQLHQRAEPSGDSATSAVNAVDCLKEEDAGAEDEEVQNTQNEQDSSPWGKGPFIVFERGRCGYAAFDPNCCKLWESVEYSLAGTSPRSSREGKQPSGRKVLVEPTSLFKNDILDNVQRKTSVTRITVASDLEREQGEVLCATATNKTDGTSAPSKQTQVHAPDTKDTSKEFMGIEKVDLTRDIVNPKNPSTVQKDACDSSQSVGTGPRINYPIPEVVISGTNSPTPKEYTSAEVYQKVPKKSLPRQRNVDGEASKETKHESNDHHDQEKETIKVDILNYMIKSSPKKAPGRTPSKEGQNTLKEASGFSDSKKSVRFKELPQCHSSNTKGRAVYIGTSKHTSPPKREIFDCLSMTVERRCVTLEGTKKATTAPCEKPAAPAGKVESPKGVKEYVTEYSELCKASVDQERQILQTVIDSVREYYKMPTALDNTVPQTKDNNKSE